jgi:NAD(P)-dependent dehydrogenase (short-subunit alcohol dehydrogenase family)
MHDALFSVSNQIVLISGASRGIGKGLAKGFAQRGATVVITGREQHTLDDAAAELSRDAADGGAVHTVVCDAAKPDDITRAVDRVIGEHGRIDTLVNCAGVNIRKPAEQYTPDEYDYIVGINLRGAFLMAQAAGRHMLERGRGSVINIDSLNSHAPLKHVTPYAMSKAGMKAMTRALAMEWGGRGVRVNGLAPGFILTPLTEKLWSNPTMRAWGEGNTPLGRLGVPDDLVGTAVFLASDASAFVTGQTLYVDGGFVAGMAWPIEKV